MLTFNSTTSKKTNNEEIKEDFPSFSVIKSRKFLTLITACCFLAISRMNFSNPKARYIIVPMYQNIVQVTLIVPSRAPVKSRLHVLSNARQVISSSP